MRFFSVVASAWARVLVSIMVAMFMTLALADVEFIEPSAGSSLTAGQIEVRWKDSGINTPISELTQYTLSLMIGGNDLDNMVCLYLSNHHASPKLIFLSATCGDIRVGRGIFYWILSARNYSYGNCCRCPKWIVC